MFYVSLSTDTPLIVRYILVSQMLKWQSAGEGWLHQESVKYSKYTYFYRPLLQAILMKYNSTGKKEIHLNFSNCCNSSHRFSHCKPADELWYGKYISINSINKKSLVCGRVLILLLNNEALVNFSTKIWNSSQSASLYPAILSLFLCGILTYTNVSRVSF